MKNDNQYIKLTENDLKEIIKEELGILLEIVEISKKVYDNILVDIKKQPKVKSDTCSIISGHVPCTLKDVHFNVYYTYRNFFDINVVNSIGVDALTEGGSGFISKDFVVCNIDILGVSGNINKQMALSTIQHELEHLYQQISSNKRIPGNDMLYAKMRNDMEGDDETRYNAARLVYACYKSEQEGFINGTYAWCMADDSKTKPYDYSEIKNSPAGKLYEEMKTLYLKSKTDMSLRNVLEKEYSLSQKIIENKIRDFGRRLGRVLIKVNNDKSKIWRK